MDKTRTIAALFDFDGVVMDTEPQYSLFWSGIGSTYLPEIENFERLIKGQTLMQIFGKYFVGEERIQDVIRDEINEFEETMSFQFVAGVLAFVDEIRSRQVTTAIVTSSNRFKMQNVYRVYPDLKQLFDHIIVAEDFAKSKPDPECYLLGASKSASEAENCFVFEDSFHGLEAGRRAGMNVIGLSTTNAPQMIKDKADLVIPDFTHFSYDKMLAVKAGK